MAHTACLVFLVSTASGCHKNTLGRPRASSSHITKLEQYTFFDFCESPKVSRVAQSWMA